MDQLAKWQALNDWLLASSAYHIAKADYGYYSPEAIEAKDLSTYYRLEYRAARG